MRNMGTLNVINPGSGGRFMWFVMITIVCVILDHRSHVVDCRVYMSEDKQSDVRVVTFAGGAPGVELLRRVRRDSAGGGSGGSGVSPGQGADPAKQPGVKPTVLNDTNHNEAIVYWTGNNSSTMFVLTRQHQPNGTVPDSTLWRSTDYGSVFKEVNVFPKGTLIRYFYSCPTNKKKLIFTDTKNKLIFTTINEGKDFTKYQLDISPDRLLFHPTEENSVLLYNYRERKLKVSYDLGERWELVSNFVNPRFFWAEPEVDHDKNRIHMEAQDPHTGRYVYKSCVKPYEDCVYDEQLGFIDIMSILVQNEYIFAQKTSSFYDNSELLVSHNRGPFMKAYFPIENHNHPQHFRIMTTDDHQVFLVADHQEPWVNLYLSDTTGHYFISSLQKVVAFRPDVMTFKPDLYEVQGLKGTYIANVQSPDQKGSVTYITFDQGGQWDRIPAPAKDFKGQDTKCQWPACSLHLHLESSLSMLSILSEENAPGIILAQGNLDTKLDSGKSTLFISSDGGLSWKMLFDGTYNYNILDQGGAMVAVNLTKSRKTNEIIYSCTEFDTWEKYQFYKAEVQVEGILNEPGINTLITSIYGHLSNDSGWVITKVDFSSILNRPCTKSDYKQWTPSDAIKGKQRCILGQQYTYQRLKSNSTCVNGPGYKPANASKNCVCSEADYECDFGYSKDKNSQLCKAEAWFKPGMPVGECPEGSTYVKSKGYRKIAADKCEGNIDKYDTQNEPCPLMKPDALEIKTRDGKLTVSTDKPVFFELIQKKGSKKSTNYTWSVGDKLNTPKTFIGFNKSCTYSFTYRERGVVEVKVVAENAVGSSTASLVLHVEDEIVALFVDMPHGAKTGYPVKFEVEPLTESYNSSDLGNTHFLWSFGDEHPAEKPLLTYGRTIKYQYEKPGNYTATIEAVNSVSSVFKRFSVNVYGTLTTVQLTFDGLADRIYQHNPVWRSVFEDVLRKQLSEELLNIPKERLEVVVLIGTPTKVDVSILPRSQDMTSDDTIPVIVKKLQSLTNNQSLLVDISYLDNRFQDEKVKAVRAEILDDEPLGGNSPRDYTAVYVCVPILIAAIFVSVLVVMYYKRKFSSYRRYSVLQSHSSAEAEDTLLGDDDDDDPPLDPNPDHQGSLGDDEEFDIGQFGRSPALVMMTGTSHDDIHGSVNC